MLYECIYVCMHVLFTSICMYVCKAMYLNVIYAVRRAPASRRIDTGSGAWRGGLAGESVLSLMLVLLLAFVVVVVVVVVLVCLR